MKNILFLFACLLALPTFAQGDEAGIQFEHKPFAELLKMAKAEDKVIFIDAYTTWCGPCKMMAKNVFPDKAVGDVYNERFINAKIDMEKGEGPEIAKRYSVMAYPTYLFVNGDGEIVHKGLGYIPQEAFLELADAASGDNSLGALNKRYAEGERDGDFLKSYSEVLTQVYEEDKANEVVGVYLSQLDDWSGESTLELLINNMGEAGGKRMNYIIEHQDEAMKLEGSGALIDQLQESFVTGQMKASGQRKLPDHKTMNALYDEHAGSLAQRLTDHYKMAHAQYSRNNEKYMTEALEYFGKYPSDNATELNSIAWTIYESSDDKDMLKQGLELAKQSVAIEADYANMDTLAWLYEKTGDHKMAVETAKKAIQMAKDSGQDYSETEKILSL